MYVKSFYYFLLYQSFQGSRKIELKTRLPLVSKEKKHAKFWRYGKSVLYKFFINSPQNVQSWFLILLRFKSFLSFFFFFFFFFWHQFYVQFLGVFIKNIFWSITFKPYIRKSKWLPFLESTSHFLSYDYIQLDYI